MATKQSNRERQENELEVIQVIENNATSLN